MPPAKRWRGIQYFEKDERGKTKCVGCGLCMAVCPSQCIYIETAEDEEGRRYPLTYELDASRCIFCGFCEDACPTEEIVLGDNYELSFTDRRQAIYTKEMLLDPVPEGGQPTPQRTPPGVFTRSVPQMKDPAD